MENPNYYAIIPANIRYDNTLSGNEKLLYGEITALSNKFGYCNAKNAYFSELYGKHKDTISDWISKLKQRGYIKTEIIKNDLGRVSERRIYPVGENAYTYRQKYLDPIGKNTEDNNTSINNKEKEEGLSKIIDFYQNNITLIVDHVAEEMESFLDDGLEPELIIAAMEEAVDRNKRNWKYVKTILNDCINNKVSTAKQFKIKQEEFKSNRKQPEKKDVTKEKIEYAEVEMTEEEYRKKLFEGAKDG